MLDFSNSVTRHSLSSRLLNAYFPRFLTFLARLIDGMSFAVHGLVTVNSGHSKAKRVEEGQINEAEACIC
jgi:hypothetical protein